MKYVVLNILLAFSTLLNIGLIAFIIKILRKSEDKTLEKLFSIGFPILIVSKEGHIIKANDFAASFYGIPKEELENKTVFDINTAGKEYLMEFIKRGLENSYQRCLFKHKTKYGEKDVETSVIPITYKGKKHLLCIVEDISEKTHIKTELELKEELLKNIYENAQVCILIYDEEFKILQASPWCFRLLEYKLEELNGKKITDIIVENDENTINVLKPKPYQKISSIFKFKRLDGSIIQAKLITSVIIHQANMLNIATIYDIQEELEQKEAYKALSETDELTQAYNRRFFDKILDTLVENYKNKTAPFSLIIFDIDDFKKINDTYGHDAGDLILKHISELVKANIRQEDIFCRIGEKSLPLY
ncbi:sensor domain-containing diguanylate cyclase [Hydrogenobaculum sp.]